MFVRYLVLEQLRVFAAALAIFALFLVGFGVTKEAVLQGFGANVVWRLLPYVLPDALRFAAPAAALLAVCKVYGEMAAANELLAVKALGISPWRVFLPGIVFGGALSLPTLWLTDVAASWGYNGVRRVIIQSVADIAYASLAEQHSYRSPQFSLHVKRLEGWRMINPTLCLPATADAPSLIATVEEGELRCDSRKNVLAIILRRGVFDFGSGVTVRFPDTQTLEFPLMDASRYQEPVAYALRDLPAEIARQQQRVADLERKLIEPGAVPEDPRGVRAADAADARRRQVEELAEQRNWLSALKTKPYRRWAWGWSCLCFVLVGMPLAARCRRADYLSIFFLAFMPVLMVNYLVLSYTVAGTNFGRLPPYTVWTGNVLLLGAGAWLLWGAVRR